MWSEKQIQIEKNEWEVLNDDDRKNLDLINNFLIKNEAKTEENIQTIEKSWNTEINSSWAALKTKFSKRIKFIDSDPNPNSYRAFSERSQSAEEQKLILTNKNDKAINYNKKLLQEVISEYTWEKNKQKKVLKKIKDMYKKYDQKKVDEYNQFLMSNVWLPITDIATWLVSNIKIGEATELYKKYDNDQKKILEQMDWPTYLDRLKKEFNYSDGDATAHLETRKFNVWLWYNLSSADERYSDIDAAFNPYDQSDEISKFRLSSNRR